MLAECRISLLWWPEGVFVPCILDAYRGTCFRFRSLSISQPGVQVSIERLIESGFPWWIRLLVWLRRAVRDEWLDNLLKPLRERLTWRMLHRAHRVSHAARELSVLDFSLDELGRVLTTTTRYCNECADLVALLYDIREPDVHCTIKVFTRDDAGELFAATIGRSETTRHRFLDVGLASAHPARANSVFASLLGLPEGVVPDRPYSCFCSNDLLKYGARFRCDRDRWSDFYRSVLVFPLRYRRPAADKSEVVGCLTFDRPRVDGFDGLPDVFASDFDDYHDMMYQSASWHLLASVADSLASVLWHRLPSEDSEDGTQ